MLDPSIFLFFIMCIVNGRRALQKGYNRWVWALITLAGIFIGEVIGGTFVVLAFCRDVIDFNRFATDASYNNTATQLLQQEFENNPLRWISIDLFGIGGYLAVRYILDKRQPKNKDGAASATGEQSK